MMENKARRMNFDPFFSVSNPEDEAELINKILISLGVIDQEHSSCLKKNQLPSIELSFRGSTLWPVLVCEQTGLFFCALPLVEDESRDVIDHLSISMVFSFLQKVMLLFNTPGNEASKLLRIESFLCSTAPLGRYITSASNQ
jgi:hypothetical protein